MKSIQACASRTCLLVSILLAAGVGWAQTASQPATGPASRPASVLKPGDHILFIGDSITGLGDRDITTQSRDTEFVPLIRQALAATHKDSKFELVTLGASGSTVGAWNSFFARAADPKQKEFFTDVPNNGVKATLAKNWDVVIIMLGMNDVLQPQVNDDEKSLKDWDASYAQLIQTARDRLHPRVVALAQCTMASEDTNSAMNKFIRKLNEHVAELAKKADCVLLPTNDRYTGILFFGRGLQSDFHIMYDFIHPNKEGQLAIASAMLDGLDGGYTYGFMSEQCTKLFAPLRKKGTIGHCVVQPYMYHPHGEITVFDVYFPDLILNKTISKFDPPPGFEVCETYLKDSGSVGLAGNLNRSKNVIHVERKSGEKTIREEIIIPAPWLITAGPIHLWPEHKFDEKAARTAIDDAIEAGKDFTGPIDVVMQTSSDGNPQPKTTGKLTWHRFFPSVDYTGGDAPGNVDFWSISYPHAFETGYAARWVWSDKDRPVRLVASSKGFTRQTYMQVWVNGKKEYGGEISEEKDMKKEFPGTLKKGWNCVAFRCCHRTYFFQSDLEMLPVEKDNLDDLRFSVVPKK